MNDARSADQRLTVTGDAAGIVQLAGSHNSVTIYIAGSVKATGAAPEPPQGNGTRVGGEVGENPYLSLLSFDETSHALFFGREALTRTLLSRLGALLDRSGSSDAPRLLGILGPSGSGKSSVARAGLIPAIARSENPRLARARVAVLLPGSAPVEQLARALARIATGDASPAAKTLEFETLIRQRADGQQHDGLTRIAAELAEPDRPLVLLIDQFEETYTLTRPTDAKDQAAADTARAERAAFIGALWHSVTAQHRNLVVVLTLRVDFFGAVSEHPVFARAVTDSHELVGPMLDGELRAAIVKPAALRNYTFSEPAVRQLIDQVRDNPGALPLLQHALTRFWSMLQAAQDEPGHQVALAVLADIGSAMANNADERMRALDPAAQTLAWRTFTASVQLGEGVGDTRRRVTLREILPAGVEEPELRRALEPFVHDRLLSLGGEAGRQETAWVEITHEALIAHWEALRQRITPETRETLRLAQRAQDAAERWEAGKGGLWQGIDLAQLRRLDRAQVVTDAQARFFAAGTRREVWQKRVGVAAGLLLLFVAVGASVAAWLVNDQRIALAESVREAREASSEARHQRDLAIDATNFANEVATRAGGDVRIMGQALLVKERTLQDAIRQRDLILLAQVTRLARISRTAMRGYYHEAPLAFVADVQAALALAVEALHEAVPVLSDAATWPAESAGAEALAANREMTILRGHQSQVFSVAFAPLGDRLASAGQDGTVRLWNAITGVQIGEPMLGHDGGVTSIAFAPDGEHLASAGEDSTVRIWGVVTRTQIGEPLRGHEGTVTSIAFAPDGERLASAGDDGTVRLWSTVTRAQIGEPMRGHRDHVNAVAFSPDGGRLASAGEDGTVRLWNAATRTQIGSPIYVGDERATAIAFAPAGDLIAFFVDGKLLLWDVATSSPSGQELRNEWNWVFSLAFERRGERLAAVNSDGRLQIWDTASRTLIGAWGRESWGLLTSVAFAPQGARLAFAGSDGTIRLWDATERAPFGEPIVRHTGRVLEVAFAPQSRRLASVGADGTVQLWDAASNPQVGEPMRGNGGQTYSVSFSPEGSHLAVANEDGTVRLWDAARRSQVGDPIRGHDGAVYSVAFADGAGRLASAGADGTVRLLDATTQSQIGEPMRGHQGAINSIAFAAGGERLASAGVDGTVRLWDTVTRMQIGEPMRGHQGAVYSVAFADGGGRFASAGVDGTVRLWDADTQSQIGEPMRGHQGAVHSIAFAAGGERLASAGADGTVRLWDAATQSQFAELAGGHTGAVIWVAFAPGGDRMASAGEDGTVRLWAVYKTRAHLMQAAEAALVRCPSRRQRVALALADPTRGDDIAPAARPPRCQ